MKYAFGALAQGLFGKPENLKLLANTGEALGFDIMWVNDHIIMPSDIKPNYPYTKTGEFNEFGDQGDYLEQLTVLSFLAGITQKVGLLTSVMVVPYREPIVTAKAIASIDVLSNGRVILGCGAGWMKEEFEALNRPPFNERGSITEEYIKIFKNLWSDSSPSFEGKYASYNDIVFAPKPKQQPHPPIWMGGESKPALRRAARLADVWFPIIDNPRNLLDTPKRFADGINRMKEIAELEGRNPDEIGVSFAINLYDDTKEHQTAYGKRRVFTGSPEQIASDISEYKALGAECLMIGFAVDPNSTDATIEQMHRFADEIRPMVGD